MKDPITAQGIADAFLDAERLDYQRSRDQHALPMYELTCQLALLEPPPPEMQRPIGAIRGNQGAMDAFAQMNAGMISPAEFMSSGGAGEGGAGPSSAS